MAPSASDLDSSTSWSMSMSETAPRPSQRGHMPPSRLNVALTAFLPPTEMAPWEVTEGTLKEKALGEPTCGSPSLLNKMRRKALADRKSTRLNSSHVAISYAVFCLKKKTKRK